jgi:hypothetical protein
VCVCRRTFNVPPASATHPCTRAAEDISVVKMQTIRDHSKFLQETMKKTFADHGEQPAATAGNENGRSGGPGIVNTGASGAAATREMVDQVR